MKSRYKSTLMRAAVLLGAAVSLTMSANAQCSNCGLAAVNVPSTWVLASQAPAASNQSSYFNITIQTAGAGSSLIANQSYLGWCVDDPFSDLEAAPAVQPTSTVNLSTSDPLANPNWFRVNWVLNNKIGTAQDIQKVIWMLLYGSNVAAPVATTPSATSLYNQAMAVTSFTPGPGQVMGILLAQDGFGGAQDTMVELRIPECGTVGDFVWADTNSNGIQDPGELGINGVTVTLYKTDVDGAIASMLTTTVNNQPGTYRFTGLCEGDYRVVVTVPEGFTQSPTGAGTTGTDSNVNGSGTYINPVSPVTRSDMSLDFGFVPPPVCTGRIGNLVWFDDGDGIFQNGELGVPNVTVQLFNASGTFMRSAQTSSTGQYVFENLCQGTYRISVLASTVPSGYIASPTLQGGNTELDSNLNPDTNVVLSGNDSSNMTIDFAYTTPCTGTIGNFVWLDTSRNGLQETGEPGIGGVTVFLKNQAGVTIASMQTSSTGAYLFTGLCRGTYSVNVDANTVPASYTPTTSPVNSDPAKDSNPRPSQVVLANNASSDLTVDFGYLAPQACNAILGDRVWLDANANGIQDSGEMGLAGVTVKLFNSANVLVQTQTTGTGGIYSFTGLCSGTYSIAVTNPSSPVGNQPGLTATTVTVSGSNTGNDSNPNPTVATAVPGVPDLSYDFGFRPSGYCTFTIGYWKTHEAAWPVSSLVLGSQTYTRTELLAIFNTPVRGDDSMNLAHQLIGAKLNMLAGAALPSTVPGYIQIADTLLSGFTGKLPYKTKNSSMVSISGGLDNFNNGLLAGASHCDESSIGGKGKNK